MTNAKAIIIGFSLVASSILFIRGIESAEAFGGGKFTIANDDNGLAWVLNTESGNLTLCKPVTLTSKVTFVCGKQVYYK